MADQDVSTCSSYPRIFNAAPFRFTYTDRSSALKFPSIYVLVYRQPYHPYTRCAKRQGGIDVETGQNPNANKGETLDLVFDHMGIGVFSALGSFPTASMM